MHYELLGNTHTRIFDSVEDLIDSCKTAKEKNVAGTTAWAMYNERKIGKCFESWEHVYETARSPWDEGVTIVERMVRELDSVDLPKPKSRKRRPRFNEDSGDEVDYDRLRSGQAFWRQCKRESMTGPQTVTIVIDLNAQAKIPHENIMWRGAAAIAMTKILEEADFRVELWIIHCADKCHSNGQGHCNAVCLKRAGDPLDIATFSAAVSGWFYRSLMFRAKGIGKYKVVRGAGAPRPPRTWAGWNTVNEVEHVTGDPNAILISGAYSEGMAAYIAREALKKLAGVEDPPPPPVEPDPEPVKVAEPEPPKPETPAERRARVAAEKKADKEWREYLKKRERENVEC